MFACRFTAVFPFSLTHFRAFSSFGTSVSSTSIFAVLFPRSAVNDSVSTSASAIFKILSWSLKSIFELLLKLSIFLNVVLPLAYVVKVLTLNWGSKDNDFVPSVSVFSCFWERSIDFNFTCLVNPVFSSSIVMTRLSPFHVLPVLSNSKGVFGSFRLIVISPPERSNPARVIGSDFKVSIEFSSKYTLFIFFTSLFILVTLISVLKFVCSTSIFTSEMVRSISSILILELLMLIGIETSIDDRLTPFVIPFMLIYPDWE